MLPLPSSVSPAQGVHAAYGHVARRLHRQVAPTGMTDPLVAGTPLPVDPADFSPPPAASLELRLFDLFDAFDGDHVVQQRLRMHTGPQGVDYEGFLRASAASAAAFMATFGLRSAIVGAFSDRRWALGWPWMAAAAATVPAAALAQRLTGAPAPATREGLPDDAIASGTFLALQLLRLRARVPRTGSVAAMAEAMGLSALTGLAVTAAGAVLGSAAPGEAAPPSQAPGEAMVQRALLVAPVAVWTVYVSLRGQLGQPPRALDGLGALLLLAIVWCLRHQRPEDWGLNLPAADALPQVPGF